MAKKTHRRAIILPSGLDNSLRRLARLRSVEEDRDVSVTELIIEAAERLVQEEFEQSVNKSPFERPQK